MVSFSKEILLKPFLSPKNNCYFPEIIIAFKHETLSYNFFFVLILSFHLHQIFFSVIRIKIYFLCLITVQNSDFCIFLFSNDQLTT